ncbi:MAG: peptidylprolyl isomerase [Pseudomonadota bacterium]
MHFYKEPLFHFLLLGLTVFAWFAYLNPDKAAPEPADRIAVDEGDIDRLIELYSATWNRPPSLQELEKLQDTLVQEEILVREARALGLDRGDSVVRQRLSQKMVFLMTSMAQAAEPDEETLRAFLSDNPARFEEPGRIAFRQIALGPDPDSRTVDAAIAALNGGAPPADVAAPSLLPESFPLSGQQQIDGMFGAGVFAELSRTPAGQWAGPVRSGYGLHIVRVDAVEDHRLPPLEDIRDEVLFEWRRDLVANLLDDQRRALRARYEITVLPPDELAAKLAQ